MNTKPNVRQRLVRRATFAVIAIAFLAVSTYGTWGYERHLAVESSPIANAEINPEFQFAIEYRKRFNFLPGAKLSLVATDRDGIAALRPDAITAYDWSVPDLTGTTYVYVADYKPLSGWVERVPGVNGQGRNQNGG